MKKEKKHLKVHPDARKFVDVNWTIAVYKTPQRHSEASIDKKNVDLSLFKCGHCASAHIEFDNGWGVGSMAGGSEWKEFHCLDCQYYTLFEKEWG